MKLDDENGNDLWRCAIQQKMEKVCVAFQLLERGAAPPPGHQFIKLHMIFDVKMDFTRKASKAGCRRAYDRNSSINYLFFHSV